MILTVTGHRPDKIGGYKQDAFKEVLKTARMTLELLTPEEVITGMAIGWDTAIAMACVEKNIPFTAAIPFKGQESRWQPQDQNRYHSLLSKAAHVNIVSDGPYFPNKMEIRNRWMVDRADKVLALYNGDDKGGTANCVRYVMKQRKPLYNAWRLHNRQSTALTQVDYDA